MLAEALDLGVFQHEETPVLFSQNHLDHLFFDRGRIHRNVLELDILREAEVILNLFNETQVLKGHVLERFLLVVLHFVDLGLDVVDLAEEKIHFLLDQSLEVPFPSHDLAVPNVVDQNVFDGPGQNLRGYQVLEVNQLFILLEANQPLQDEADVFKVDPVETEKVLQLPELHGAKLLQVI